MSNIWLVEVRNRRWAFWWVKQIRIYIGRPGGPPYEDLERSRPTSCVRERVGIGDIASRISQIRIYLARPEVARGPGGPPYLAPD